MLYLTFAVLLLPLAVPALPGDSAQALRASLERRPVDIDAVVASVTKAVEAADPEAVDILLEGYRAFAVTRRNWEQNAARLLAKVEGKAEEGQESRRGARRSSGDDQAELQMAETQRRGFSEMQDRLHQGLIDLLLALGSKGDRTVVDINMKVYEGEFDASQTTEKTLVEIKGKLAETLSRYRRAREAGRDEIAQDRAALEALIHRLEGEMRESREIQDGCFRSIRTMINTLSSADSKDVVRTISAKIDKRASNEEKLRYMELVAGLGQEKTPELIEDIVNSTTREIRKQEEEVTKLRDRYDKNLAGYFGQNGAETGATRVRVRDALEAAQKAVRDAADLVGELERVRRAACVALPAAVRAIESEKAFERKVDWMLKTVFKEKDIDSRAYLIQGLGRCDHPEVRSELHQVIGDSAESVPTLVAALDALVELQDRECLNVVREKLLHHQNWEVQTAAALVLTRIPDRESIPALIELLATADGRLKEDVHIALQALTGQKIGPNATLWKQWWFKAQDTFDFDKIERKQRVAVAMEDPAEGSGTTFYGIQTESHRIAFVLDVSLSMQEPATDSSKTRFEVLKQELKSVLATLTEEDEFTIIVYCGHAERWKDRMTKASDAIKQQAAAWIDQLELCEGTDIHLGIMTAFKLAGLGATDSNYRTTIDTIYFLSDGQPTVGEVIDPDEIRVRSREANKLSRIRIHTIGVGDNEKDTNFALLYGMAEDSGGNFVKR